MKNFAKRGVNVTKLTRQEWLTERQKGIGGSDAAAVIGVSPWKSAAQVYMDKVEPIAEEDEAKVSERLRIGHDLEAYVAKRFMEETGKKVRRCNYMLHHPEHEFLLADIDREIVGENALLECKTTNSYAAGEWVDEPPEHYQMQCIHYMMVTGVDRVYIAALIGNERFVWFVLERDEEAIAALMQAEIAFWRDNVEARVCPPPDGSNAYSEYLKARYPQDDGGQMTLSVDGESALVGYLAMMESRKKLDESIELYRQQIEAEMGEAQIAHTLSGHKVTWKTQSRTTIDAKRLKKELPGVYDTFAKESTSRVFRVSEMRG